MSKTPDTQSIWWSRRAISLHVALVVFVPAFLVLAYWQAERAVQGNSLSWAYTFEWPFFAAYATWMWWRLIHDESPVPRRRRWSSRRAEVPGESKTSPDGAAEPDASAPFDPYDDSVDPELAAYNRYLASLHAADRTRRK